MSCAGMSRLTFPSLPPSLLPSPNSVTRNPTATVASPGAKSASGALPETATGSSLSCASPETATDALLSGADEDDKVAWRGVRDLNKGIKMINISNICPRISGLLVTKFTL